MTGVQKGGTTNLRFNLESHPQLMGAKREVHFFDKYIKMSYNGSSTLTGPEAVALLGDYTARLVTCGLHRHRHVGNEPGFFVDVSPRYIFTVSVPYRVRSLLPHARIVLLLRDPVDRYFSELRMYLCRGYRIHHFHRPGRVPKYLEMAAGNYTPYEESCRGPGASVQALRRCEKGALPFEPLTRGLYADQLERWFSLGFEPAQILVLDSAELFADFTEALRRVTAFVGLRPFDFHYDGSKQSPDENCSQDKTGDKFAKIRAIMAQTGDEALLREYYFPHNERLFKLLRRDLGWNDKYVPANAAAAAAATAAAAVAAGRGR
ncbi:unnamed protein product [Phaeothamnion confervicola]